MFASTIPSQYAQILRSRMLPSRRAFPFLTSRRPLSTYSNDAIKNSLKALLRDMAQPVAVVTSGTSPETFHGATLSSLASIAMDPYPLVSFALRMPSRMASLLKQHPHTPMVINLLSADQASIAVQFSRADLYPEPFTSLAYSTESTGYPVLDGVIGALYCDLVSTTPLHDLEFLSGAAAVPVMQSLPRAAVVSELYIARVLRVMGEEHSRVKDRPPLIYYRRGYTSCA